MTRLMSSRGCSHTHTRMAFSPNSASCIAEIAHLLYLMLDACVDVLDAELLAERLAHFKDGYACACACALVVYHDAAHVAPNINKALVSFA
jgi:hypothetical protein